MRHIRDMSIVEIDITNQCHKRCSNCTRFCGHHAKPFFMDFATFKRAVDSLEGHQGLISTIGGEPLLHPEYDRFAAYLRTVRGSRKHGVTSRSQAMLKDYPAFTRTQRWFEVAMNAGRGHLLFTSIPPNYYRHYEAVQDTVDYLELNDHVNPSFHQPILVSRKDLGIGDEEFAVLRDACWLQNFWSCSITPKGAFFCEIAANLDMLFDGPGGKPLEPGWWRKDISEFADQFHWCDICGMALKTYTRNANDGADDASHTLFARLEEMQTPKFAKGDVLPFDPATARRKGNSGIGEDMASMNANYLSDSGLRVGGPADAMKPKGIFALLAVRDGAATAQLPARLRSLASAVDGFYIVAPDNCKDAVQRAVENRDDCRVFFIAFAEERPIDLGDALARAVKECGTRDWLIALGDDAELPEGFAALLRGYYLNPGYLFSTGQAVVFSKMAAAVVKLGHDGLRACATPAALRRAWGEKVLSLEPGFESLPDVDIDQWRQQAFAEYAADSTFTQSLKERMAALAPGGGAVLVLQSAFVFHTLGLAWVLETLGYTVHVLGNERFKDYFAGWLPQERCRYFTESHFTFAAQKNLRDVLRRDAAFVGAIVPFSFGPSTVKPIDDYTDALRTAEDVAGRILGIVNIRRQFIDPEYDIWAES